jgi:hypothetical protein
VIEFGNKMHGLAITAKAETLFNRDVDSTISRSEDSSLLGGVVFSDFTQESIAIHVAGFRPGWLNRDMLWVMFHYPFVQLKVKKLFGFIKSSNTKTLDFASNIGFKEETRIRGVYSYADIVVLVMERETCRWLSIKPRDITNGFL